MGHRVERINNGSISEQLFFTTIRQMVPFPLLTSRPGWGRDTRLPTTPQRAVPPLSAITPVFLATTQAPFRPDAVRWNKPAW
jgi:hypothetical protein